MDLNELHIVTDFLLVILFYLLWKRIARQEKDYLENCNRLLEICNTTNKRIDLLRKL